MMVIMKRFANAIVRWRRIYQLNRSDLFNKIAHRDETNRADFIKMFVQEMPDVKTILYGPMYTIVDFGTKDIFFVGLRGVEIRKLKNIVEDFAFFAGSRWFFDDFQQLLFGMSSAGFTSWKNRYDVLYMHY